MKADGAQALEWLALARQLLAELSAHRKPRNAGVHSAALDLVPELAYVAMLVGMSRPERTEAGFDAACALHTAAVELSRLIAAGPAADPGDLAHVGWLLGRAHVRAQVCISTSRGKGRPPGSGDPARPFIEDELRKVPRPSDAQIAALLRKLDPEHPPDVSYIGKLRRAMDADGAK